MSERVFKGPRPTREGIQDQLRTVIRRTAELADGLDRDEFNRRPADGGWSVGECLEHLNETARLYLPVLADRIDAGREEGLLARPGWGERTLIGRLFVWMQEPPPRFKMKTFAELEPASDLDPGAVLEDFETLHEELIVRINEAADLDWRRTKLRSALVNRLKLSLGDWFYFLAAHARRHLWQAARVRDELADRAQS